MDQGKDIINKTLDHSIIPELLNVHEQRRGHNDTSTDGRYDHRPLENSKISSPTNAPHNVLMLDSPSVSEFNDPMHQYERIESKDSEADRSGMTPIPFYDDTREEDLHGNLQRHSFTLSTPNSFDMIAQGGPFLDDRSNMYAPRYYPPGPPREIRNEYIRKPSNSPFHGYHHDAYFPFHSFRHHEVPPQYSHYPHMNRTFGYSSVHQQPYSSQRNNDAYNQWINTTTTLAGSPYKGITDPDATQHTRVVIQRATNMIDEVVPKATKDEDQDTNYTNPRYVIRASYKAFANIKYQLPCIRSVRDICPVNISAIHGSIRHYTNHSSVDVRSTVREKDFIFPFDRLCLPTHK
jgi:hypothetical protein